MPCADIAYAFRHYATRYIRHTLCQRFVFAAALMLMLMPPTLLSYADDTPFYAAAALLILSIFFAIRCLLRCRDAMLAYAFRFVSPPDAAILRCCCRHFAIDTLLR